MGKRISRQRRLLQRQGAALAAVRTEQSSIHAAEMAKLQQGHVRSGLRSNPTSKTFRAPNWTGDDVAPKKGKIVKGKFKPVKPGSQPRFASKGGKIVGGKFIPETRR